MAHPSQLDRFIDAVKELPFDGAPERRLIYDGKEREAHYCLFYSDFTADFCFFAVGAAPGLRNYLTVRIYQSERGQFLSPLSVSLSDTMLAIEKRRYVSCDYPFIASDRQLDEALEELRGVFLSALPELQRFMADRSGRTAVFGSEADEINNAFGEEIFGCENGVFTGKDDEDDLVRCTDMFRRMKLSRRFTPPYTGFYTGEASRALRGMSSYAGRDRGLEELARLSEDDVFFSPLQKELYGLYKKSDGLRSFPALLAGLLLSLLAGILPAALIFVPIYFFASGAFFPSTVFSTSADLQCLYLILPVWLFGWIMLLFDQSILLRVIYGKKTCRDYAAMVTAGERRFMRTTASVLFALLVCFTVFAGARTVRFEKDRFSDSRAFLSLEQVYRSYGEIEKAGLVGRANGKDAILRLKMKDGTVIDVDTVREKKIEEKILPLLDEHGVSVGRYADDEAFERS